MNFSLLKELVKKLGTLLIVNGSEPEFVVMDYQTYKKHVEGAQDVRPDEIKSSEAAEAAGEEEQPSSGEEPGFSPLFSMPEQKNDEQTAVGNGDEEMVERLNKEILALKEEIKELESEVVDDSQETQI
ncbi:MAG: hypothetical protein CEN90_394 [Parcubacteria group bacterium Licking1014_17]|nr:MAG: hypothetical protein CEN90_394 [Parcubacteria group bacterium Licking1014_17]